MIGLRRGCIAQRDCQNNIRIAVIRANDTFAVHIEKVAVNIVAQGIGFQLGAQRVQRKHILLYIEVLDAFQQNACGAVHGRGRFCLVHLICIDHDDDTRERTAEHQCNRAEIENSAVNTFQHRL